MGKKRRERRKAAGKRYNKKKEKKQIHRAAQRSFHVAKRKVRKEKVKKFFKKTIPSAAKKSFSAVKQKVLKPVATTVKNTIEGKTKVGKFIGGAAKVSVGFVKTTIETQEKIMKGVGNAAENLSKPMPMSTKLLIGGGVAVAGAIALSR